MPVLIAKWHNVKYLLPSDTDWKIVRCINCDEDSDFYFMAYYCVEYKIWEFFDDEYEDSMQVTHWQKAPKIPLDIKFTKNNKDE